MRLLQTLVIVLFIFPCFAQTNYKIQFKIGGLKDTTAYLGSYYGESTVVNDTAKVNSAGRIYF
jgi:hypothetical protein